MDEIAAPGYGAPPRVASTPRVSVLPDPGALAEAAAALFAGLARRAVARRGAFAVALAGGETPLGCYRRLAEPPHRDAVPWERVHVFWGDERCVPPDDPRSNEGAARAALLDRVPIPAAQVHPIRCAGDPEHAARAYETVLAAFFAGAPERFDLALLGLGADGHTASLFPGSPALAERRRLAVAVTDPRDWPRVTLTPALLARSRRVVFLVTGAAKAAAVRGALTRTDADDLPARRVVPGSGRVLWVLDREAAGLLA
jgi:6-phosphogluconolactonase